MHKIKKVLDTKSFILESEKLYPNQFDYSKTEYKNYHTRVTIICKKHGEFSVLPGSHLDKRNKYGCCPICSRIASMTLDKTEIFKKKIIEHFPNSYVNYDNIKFMGTHVPVQIECPIHGIQYVKPNYYLRSKFPCPKCGIEKSHNQVEKIEKAKSEFVHISNIIHNYKYDYSKACYINDSTPLIVICPEHGEFSVTPNKHKNRAQGCPICSKRISSYAEYAFENLLKYKNIEYKTSFKIADNRVANKPYDFYIPKFNLIIEIQGSQHIEKRWNMTDTDLLNRKNIDKLKADVAKEYKYNYLATFKNSIPNIKKIVNAINISNNINDFIININAINNLMLVLSNE